MSNLNLMLHQVSKSISRIIPSSVIIAIVSFCASQGIAQETPLISGGVGFFTSTVGGNTSYLPIIEPLIAAPIGKSLLIESRAAILESFTPDATGYSHSHFAGLTYLQGDLTLVPHVTIVGGSFLLPFATYNERLSPIWISNFQDGPLIQSLGLMGTGVGVGGQLRGSAISRPHYSISYSAWFSARSGNEQFNS